MPIPQTILALMGFLWLTSSPRDEKGFICKLELASQGSTGTPEQQADHPLQGGWTEVSERWWLKACRLRKLLLEVQTEQASQSPPDVKGLPAS